MELFEVGRGRVRLETGDFLAQGGQASIYVRGDRAFKVYHDPAQMFPAAKIQELSVLDHDVLVRPEALLLDRQHRPVGYAMRRITAAHVLCELFNRAFRERRGVSTDQVLALVRQLQAGVRHVHERGVLIVDLNEMNFLLAPDLQRLYFIDVDSYQTAGFPATAIMDSIRDRHAAHFSQETDWFSFGVVAFQMLTGIHPYKGKHPVLKDLDARMRANVSVLHPEVKIPPVCQPFSIIPPALLEWFRRVFEEGLRCAPPDDFSAALPVVLRPVVLTGDAALRVVERCRFFAQIVLPLPEAGPHVALTTEGLHTRARRHPVPAEAQLVLTPVMRQLIAAWIEAEKLVLYDAERQSRIPLKCSTEGLMTCAGRLYLKQGTTLAMVDLLDLPAGVRATLRPVANVMLHATRLWDGVVLQDVLGCCWATVCPQPGHAHSLRLPELDGARVVDARFEGGVLMVLAFRDGQYARSIFRFGSKYTDYDLRVVDGVSPADLNFVTLENGVCVHLTETGDLEVFRREKGSTGLRLLPNAGLDGVRLFRDGTQVLGARETVLYELSLHSTGARH